MFRFTTRTIHHSRALWLPFLALLFLPWAIPYITPTDEEFQLYQPALAQGAWQTLWIIGVFFGILTAANIGKLMEDKKINEHFTTLGVPKWKRFFGQLGPIWISSALMGLCPYLICLLAASPNSAQDKSMWFILQSQNLLLWMVSIPLWTAIPLALATRLSSPVSTVLTLLFYVYSTQGISYADMIRRNLAANGFFRDTAEVAWAISPHLHFADLTNRMIFKMGPHDPTGFWGLAAYLLGYSILITLIFSMVPKSKGAKSMHRAKLGSKAKEKVPFKKTEATPTGL